MMIVAQGDNSSYAGKSKTMVLKVFNFIANEALAIIDWNRQQFTELGIEMLALIDEVLQLLYKKSQGFKQELNADQSEMLHLIKDCLMITLNNSYAIVDFDTFPVFAKESLPYLIRILDIMKGLFTVNKGSEQNEE